VKSQDAIYRAGLQLKAQIIAVAGWTSRHRLPKFEAEQRHHARRQRRNAPSHASHRRGAQIEGIDLSQPPSDEQIGDIRRAFLDWLVLVFRRQTVARNPLVSMTKRSAAAR